MHLSLWIVRQTEGYSACVVTQLENIWGAYYGMKARRPSQSSSKRKDTRLVMVLSIGHIFGTYRWRMAVLPIADVPNLLHIPYAWNGYIWIDSVSWVPSNLLVILMP